MPYPLAALTHLAVSGYRSLQQLTLSLVEISLVCGAHGCSKRNQFGLLVCRRKQVSRMSCRGFEQLPGLPGIVENLGLHIDRFGAAAA